MAEEYPGLREPVNPKVGTPDRSCHIRAMDSTSETVLELRDLAVKAGGRVILRGIGITLLRGETVALCGPSGCGKTSLLRAVSGLDEAASGTVTLAGASPEETGWPAFRRRVVLVDQRPVLLPGSVRDNLMVPFTYRSAGGTAFPERDASDLLDAFGVFGERMAQEARTLSQGQQQRVCLARAFLLKPDVLLLDEPTSALDPEAVQSVERTLAGETRKRGLSALVVTHDRAQAARLCDRSVDLSAYAGGHGD